VDDDILALNPSQLAQSLPERVEPGRPSRRGRRPKETYSRDLPRLLRVGGGQRHDEEGRKQDENADACVGPQC
jgi:hypothetical protein